MTQPCTQPSESANGHVDPRYVYGRNCTWHAPISAAATRSNGEPCCPTCGGNLYEVSNEGVFQAEVQRMSRTVPEYPLLMDWSRNRCFPDFNTLENAYRQAMEGER